MIRLSNMTPIYDGVGFKLTADTVFETKVPRGGAARHTVGCVGSPVSVNPDRLDMEIVIDDGFDGLTETIECVFVDVEHTDLPFESSPVKMNGFGTEFDWDAVSERDKTVVDATIRALMTSLRLKDNGDGSFTLFYLIDPEAEDQEDSGPLEMGALQPLR